MESLYSGQYVTIWNQEWNETGWNVTVRNGTSWNKKLIQSICYVFLVRCERKIVMMKEREREREKKKKEIDRHTDRPNQTKRNVNIERKWKSMLRKKKIMKNTKKHD